MSCVLGDTRAVTPRVSVPAAPSSAIRPFCSTFLWSSKSCCPRNSLSVGMSSAISCRFSPRFPSLTPSSCCLLGAGEYEAVMSTTQMTMTCSKGSLYYLFFQWQNTYKARGTFWFFFLLWVGGRGYISSDHPVRSSWGSG